MTQLQSLDVCIEHVKILKEPDPEIGLFLHRFLFSCARPDAGHIPVDAVRRRLTDFERALAERWERPSLERARAELIECLVMLRSLLRLSEEASASACGRSQP